MNLWLIYVPIDLQKSANRFAGSVIMFQLLCGGIAEVLPPEAVALCRAKAPDAFVLLDAAHGFFGD